MKPRSRAWARAPTGLLSHAGSGGTRSEREANEAATDAAEPRATDGGEVNNRFNINFGYYF